MGEYTLVTVTLSSVGFPHPGINAKSDQELNQKIEYVNDEIFQLSSVGVKDIHVCIDVISSLKHNQLQIEP